MNLAIVPYNANKPLVINVPAFTALSQDTSERNVLIKLLWVNAEKGNHSSSAPLESATPINTPLIVQEIITKDKSGYTGSRSCATVPCEFSTDPLFEQSKLSQYATVDKVSSEITYPTFVGETNTLPQSACPLNINSLQELMDISSDEDSLDTYIVTQEIQTSSTSKAYQPSTASHIRKPDRPPKPRQVMNL